VWRSLTRRSLYLPCVCSYLHQALFLANVLFMIVLVIALAFWTRGMIIARKELLRAAWRRLTGKEKGSGDTEADEIAAGDAAASAINYAVAKEKSGRIGRLASIDESPQRQQQSTATALKGALGTARRAVSRGNLVSTLAGSVAQRAKQRVTSIMLPPPTLARPTLSDVQSPQHGDEPHMSSLFALGSVAERSHGGASLLPPLHSSSLAEMRERNNFTSDSSSSSSREATPPTATFPKFASNVPPSSTHASSSSSSSPSFHVAASSLLGTPSHQEQQRDLEQPLL
jgi:hypothetical protein